MEQAFSNYKSKYNNIDNVPNNYLYWLENDILLALNDNQGLICNMSSTIRSMYPNMTVFEIVHKVSSNKDEISITRNIEYLWSFLSEEGVNQILKGPTP